MARNSTLDRDREQPVFSVRLSLDERAKLDEVRSATGKSRNQIIAEALVLYRQTVLGKP